MSDLLQERFERFRRAGQVISRHLESPPHGLLRIAEDSGCLDELELLLEETRAWLDDDDYYDELAWNTVHGNN